MQQLHMSIENTWQSFIVVYTTFSRLIILLFIFQTNVYTRHYAFPFIPYPFYFIPFYYGLNASNTGASRFSPFSFSLPFSVPFPFLPRSTTYGVYHANQTQQTAIYCMPYFLHICFLRGFSFPLHFSTLAPFMHVCYFYAVWLFTVLYIFRFLVVHDPPMCSHISSH